MSKEFESFDSFGLIQSANNPLKVLDSMYDRYIELFWEYRFLIRDIGTLLSSYQNLKSEFTKRQEKRISQIASLLEYFMDNNIIDIPKKEIQIRAKLNWFVSSYWQVFATTTQDISKESLIEIKSIIFDIQLYPILTPKGKEMYSTLS